jgi:ABC-type branched-subunit amino acid transport system substrate-binding protein
MVKLGVLMPMFGSTSWSPRTGPYQAFREINNKSDGVADHLLPNTQLQVAYHDSKCDATEGLMGAMHLTRDAFSGEGVDAIIGTACSGASQPAAQVAEASKVPIVSPTATSSLLSDGQAYPYFARVYPSDVLTTIAIVDTVQMLFNYTSVSLMHSTYSYGAGGGSAFSEAAYAAGLAVSITQSFNRDADDFSAQQRALLQSAVRVTVLYCHASDGVRFLRTAYEVGLGGPGLLWFGGDEFAVSGLWEDDAVLHSWNYEPHNEEVAHNGEVTMSINRRAHSTLIVRS